MQSANWSFSVPLFKKNLKRFWPLWGMYSFVLFMVFPVFLLLQAQNDYRGEDLFYFFHQYGIGMAAEVAPWIALFFGVMTAMALWSYLYNSRSVSLFHSLPLNRKSLFLSNYLTGILFFLIPNLVIFLLTLGVETIVGAVAIQSLASWLLCQTLLCFFFYSFATLLAFVTGHILVLPCLFAIFNALTKVLTMLLDWAFGEFVYGYTSASIPLLNWFGRWLSPMYAFTTELNMVYPEVNGFNGQEPLPEFQGISVVCGFAVAGLIMAVLAYFLYRYRNLELSGEVIVVRFLRPVFKYGVAICAGFVFGNIFYMMFEDIFSQGISSLLFFLLIWGAIGYFAAEMLLRKSFRVIKQSYKGCLVLLLLLAAALLAMEWDFTGYEKTVPSLEEVEEVIVVGSDRVSYEDEKYMATVIALHEALVSEKGQIEKWQRGKDPEIKRLQLEEDRIDGIYIEKFSWSYVTLIYTLQDGNTLRREYQIPVTETLLEEEGSSAMLYDKLLNKPEWRLRRLFPEVVKAEDLVQIEVDTIHAVFDENETSLRKDAVSLTGEDAKLLYAAMLEDVNAGRLGTHWFLRNEEALNTNYENVIYITFRGDYNTDNMHSGNWYQKNEKEGENAVYYEMDLRLQVTATSTLGMLEQLGLQDKVKLVSRFDWIKDKETDREYGYDSYRPTIQ